MSSYTIDQKDRSRYASTKQLGSLNIAIFWRFLIKQLFHSSLLAPRWLSIILYPTRARAIIVKYTPSDLIVVVRQNKKSQIFKPNFFDKLRHMVKK